MFSFYRSVVVKKMINHNRKILELPHPTTTWFIDVIRYFSLVDFCSSTYVTINPNTHATFAERWHSETSFFHLPIGEMTITLGEVSWLLHLPIRGRLLDHGRIGREEGVDLMVTLLWVDLSKMVEEATHTRGAHALFTFLENLYNEHVKRALDVIGDDVQVEHHQHCTLWTKV